METRIAKACKEGDIISLAIELLKMELMTANEKLNGLETSCEFLAEKCDALMTILKKHNKLSDERIDSVIADVNRARNEVRMKIRFA